MLPHHSSGCHHPCAVLKADSLFPVSAFTTNLTARVIARAKPASYAVTIVKPFAINAFLHQINVLLRQLACS
jgi:hypothetical protein